MIGGNSGLINFNSADWANRANQQLQQALQAGLQYSEKYGKQAVEAVQDYDQQARKDLQQGFQRAQALQAPQRLATYNALDAYQGLLGLPTPVGGSFQLAQGMQNQITGQPNTAFQNQQAMGYNQGVQQINPGLLSPSMLPQGGS